MSSCSLCESRKLCIIRQDSRIYKIKFPNVGVTSDLVKRVWEHKNGFVEGFTKKYSVKMLVYYEPHENAENAIRREKQIKKWNRAWKEEKKI